MGAVLYNRRGGYVERFDLEEGETFWWCVYYLWEAMSGWTLHEDDAFAAIEHWQEQRR